MNRKYARTEIRQKWSFFCPFHIGMDVNTKEKTRLKRDEAKVLIDAVPSNTFIGMSFPPFSFLKFLLKKSKKMKRISTEFRLRSNSPPPPFWGLATYVNNSMPSSRLCASILLCLYGDEVQTGATTRQAPEMRKKK